MFEQEKNKYEVISELVALLKTRDDANFSVISKEEVGRQIRDILSQKVVSANREMRKYHDSIFAMAEDVTEYNTYRAALEQLGPLAEIKAVGYDDDYTFRELRGRQRAYNFVTPAARDGFYKEFRLDETSYTIDTNNYGVGMRVQHSRSNLEQLSDLMEIASEGFIQRIIESVFNALNYSMNSTSRNAGSVKIMPTGYDEALLREAITYVKYRNAVDSVVIMTSPEFAEDLRNDVDWENRAKTDIVNGMISLRDLDDIRNQGYVGSFRGNPVSVLSNRYTDEKATKVLYNPQMCYVLPNFNEKMVKVLFRGPVETNDNNGVDWTRGIQMQREMGVAIYGNANDFALVQNQAIEPYQYA